MAFSMALDAAVDPLCSDLTVLHMALWGADPFVLLAEAAVSGTSANVSPSTPAPIPTHLDRCRTVATSMSLASASTILQPFSSHRGLTGSCDSPGGVISGLNREAPRSYGGQLTGRQKSGGTRWMI